MWEIKCEAKPIGIPHGTTGPSDFVQIYTQACLIRYVTLVFFYNTCTHVSKTLYNIMLLPLAQLLPYYAITTVNVLYVCFISYTKGIQYNNITIKKYDKHTNKVTICTLIYTKCWNMSQHRLFIVL